MKDLQNNLKEMRDKQKKELKSGSVTFKGRQTYSSNNTNEYALHK